MFVQEEPACTQLHLVQFETEMEMYKRFGHEPPPALRSHPRIVELLEDAECRGHERSDQQEGLLIDELLPRFVPLRLQTEIPWVAVIVILRDVK